MKTLKQTRTSKAITGSKKMPPFKSIAEWNEAAAKLTVKEIIFLKSVGDAMVKIGQFCEISEDRGLELIEQFILVNKQVLNEALEQQNNYEQSN